METLEQIKALLRERLDHIEVGKLQIGQASIVVPVHNKTDDPEVLELTLFTRSGSTYTPICTVSGLALAPHASANVPFPVLEGVNPATLCALIKCLHGQPDWAYP